MSQRGHKENKWFGDSLGKLQGAQDDQCLVYQRLIEQTQGQQDTFTFRSCF